MPQMSPMLWSMLFMYTIMLLFISILMMYYLIIYYKINFNKLNKTMYLFLNKW
uniref:ATP synthase subunit 8 n=1 Tax=Nasonia vitripennis TaxID=7425 RepID=B5T2P1_NASVI|nr:ATP synthase F0 subunit 8 [Nasonia vitripennis]ACH81734.1 ATP synthase subunit 8 [Nasonia vitripennis]ACH81745.1 ATP synthase subunit 8 [Nasonia vitripennis]ACH85747.1 ATP synthase subunit 8 [Nasonia vitripennis]ACH85751.1 ATP synthase subunit 8 [Nasonia vitripennis]ACH85755.1 ATP synthase subunit 8 [Nasonia vitripennis]